MGIAKWLAALALGARRQRMPLRLLALGGLLLGLLGSPAYGQGVNDARLVNVSRRAKHARTKAKARTKAPAVSRERMELAQAMAREAYALGHGLEAPQRAALLTRLLYTMRPEVMAAEKKQWAEELFGLAEKMPASRAGGYAAADAAPGAGAVPTFANNGRMWATRNAAIATAAARLALYDSDRALELLDRLPGERGRREDARTMAARLVFVIYLQHRGAAGAQTLLAHAREWGEHGGFPYAASAAALARLSADEDAAEDFFRRALAVFARGQEGAFGIGEFAELLERAVATEAISEESAEEAGRAIVAQAGKLAGGGSSGVGAGEDEAGGNGYAATGAAPAAGAGGAGSGNAAQPAAGAGGYAAADAAPAAGARPLSGEARQRLAEALNDVRLAAPKAYAQAAKDWPGLMTLRAANRVSPVQELKVDAGLQAPFAELAEAMRERRGAEALREVIARGLERVNARYRAAACAQCGTGAGVGGDGYAATDAAPAVGPWVPDAQSWALVSLAAYASPMTIGAQLKAIDAPFWHAYFLAIAAQQVGEPARVADPTARRVIGKEEAEPE